MLLTSLLIVMGVNILYRLYRYPANIMSGVSRFATSFYFIRQCDLMLRNSASAVSLNTRQLSWRVVQNYHSLGSGKYSYPFHGYKHCLCQVSSDFIFSVSIKVYHIQRIPEIISLFYVESTPGICPILAPVSYSYAPAAV